MKVNFNNLRKKACRNYNSLTNILNEWIVDERLDLDQIDEINDIMSDLRMNIVSIACVYQDGQEDFKDLSDEIGDLKVFNDVD